MPNSILPQDQDGQVLFNVISSFFCKFEIGNLLRKCNAQKEKGVGKVPPIQTVHGLQTGWLALRFGPRYDYHNEIGQLYNRDVVQIMGNDAITEHDFEKAEYSANTWVYLKRLNKSGWVNSRFI